MLKQLYVVIATHNRNELLERTLTSLAECKLPECYSKTIVVENGGQFGAEETVHGYSDAINAQYLYFKQGNKSAALNYALDSIPNEPGVLVYFTDDDVRFDSQLFMKMASAAEQIDNGEFYVGPMEADFEERPPEWMMGYLPSSVVGWNPDLDDQTTDDISRVPFGKLGLGCNWAAFATDLNAAGLFDSNYGPGSKSGATGQESNMMARLLDRGVDSIYVPEAAVWHFVPIVRCNSEWALKRAKRQGIQVGQRCTTRIRTSLLDVLRICFWGISFPVLYPLGRQYRFRLFYSLNTAVGRLTGIWNK